MYQVRIRAYTSIYQCDKVNLHISLLSTITPGGTVTTMYVQNIIVTAVCVNDDLVISIEGEWCEISKPTTMLPHSDI